MIKCSNCGGAARARQLFTLLFLAGAASIPLACFIGPLALEPGQIRLFLADFFGFSVEIPTGDAAFKNGVIVTQIRLARVCLSFGAGAGLALAGVAFQGILRNPLADPFTLGVSGGAALGASLGISFGVGVLLLPFWALGGASLALASVLLLAARGGLKRESLILAGVVVSAFLAALIALVKALDEDSVSSIVFWIMGSFQNRGWQHFEIFWPFFLFGGLLLLLLHRELDLLNLGETQARLLGLEAGKVRLAILLAASCLSAACVAVSGIVGFVGIIVPHLVRLVQGPRHFWLLINSALAGGLLLLWADTLARVALPSGLELPVGVITALLGGPCFCLILSRKSRLFVAD